MNDLTNWDRQLLDRYLSFYRALDVGDRQPVTLAQKRFCRVCSGKVNPRTQHEIAYSRLKALETAGVFPYGPQSDGHFRKMSGEYVSPPEPLGRSPLTIRDPIYVVDVIEGVQFAPGSRANRKIFEKVKELYERSSAKAASLSVDAALWINVLLADRAFSSDVTAWMTDLYGHVSNVYTKAIDGAFADGLRSGPEYISPHLHRLFDHSVVEAWERVQTALPNDTLWQEARGFATAMWSDLVTPTGLPLFTLTQDQYDSAKEVVSEWLGVPVTWLNDILHVNATELVSGLVPIIPLVLAWNNDEAERYAKLVGALGIGTVVAANPLAALVALAMIARGVQKTKPEDGYRTWALGIAKGGAISGAVLATSAVVGGPAWVGLVAGAALGVWLSQRPGSVNSTDVPKFLAHKLEAFVAHAQARPGRSPTSPAV